MSEQKVGLEEKEKNKNQKDEIKKDQNQEIPKNQLPQTHEESKKQQITNQQNKKEKENQRNTGSEGNKETKIKTEQKQENKNNKKEEEEEEVEIQENENEENLKQNENESKVQTNKSVELEIKKKKNKDQDNTKKQEQKEKKNTTEEQTEKNEKEIEVKVKDKEEKEKAKEDKEKEKDKEEKEKEKEKEKEENENKKENKNGKKQKQKNSYLNNQYSQIIKGRRYQKHEEEGIHDQKWINHKKQYFIVTQTGKPIYTRYGSDVKLASFLCVPQALVSFVSQFDDEIIDMKAGGHKYIFLCKGPLILVCVSKSGDTNEYLTEQLEFLYLQTLFFLSYRIIDMLMKNPRMDLSTPLNGTFKFFDNLIYRMNKFPFAIQSSPFLKLDSKVRFKIAKLLKNCSMKFLKYAMLLTKNLFIQITQPKNKKISYADLFLIQNFISDSTLHDNVNWVPFCLPSFSQTQMLYGYIHYIDQEKEVCVCLISSNPQGFMELKELGEELKKILEKEEIISELTKAFNESKKLSASHLKIPYLKHFVYNNKIMNQCYYVQPEIPYNIGKNVKRLSLLYQTSRERLLQENKKYSIFTDYETVSSIISEGNELYSVYHPLITQEEIIKNDNTLLSWLKKNMDDLFAETFQNW
ncbi:sand protein-related [Anaeramoeba flamelloides]|uniref:Sand protein-related n=1 Tax=Anaeramoeba flamelloides TaxID=1746091 RepID=A0AAV7Y796_9EUKA|nr:sand protein-related [Anaeramoeba flamelloides]